MPLLIGVPYRRDCCYHCQPSQQWRFNLALHHIINILLEEQIVCALP